MSETIGMTGSNVTYSTDGPFGDPTPILLALDGLKLKGLEPVLDALRRWVESPAGHGPVSREEHELVLAYERWKKP